MVPQRVPEDEILRWDGDVVAGEQHRHFTLQEPVEERLGTT